MSTQTKNTESPNVASPLDATQALTLIDQAIAALALPALPSVTAKQKKAATRSRKGMEKVVPTLATLSTEHGVTIPKLQTSKLTSNLELVSELEPVKQKLVSVLTLVQDNIDSVRSETWNAASTLYGMLGKAAHRDAQLASQLAPIREFFAYRHPLVRKNHPKRKGKKAALAAGTKAAAPAVAGAPVPALPPSPDSPSATPPGHGPASASTNGAATNGAGSSSVVLSHAP